MARRFFASSSPARRLGICACVCETLRLRALDVERRGEPRLRPPAREVRGLRLRGEVRFGERQVRLEGAHIDVALHDFGGDVHERVVQPLLAGGLIAERGLDAAAQPAEQVGDPGELESARHLRAPLRRRFRAQHGLRSQRRPQVRFGHGTVLARLLDALARHLEVEIAGERARHQIA